jgi:outer membrane scaffolding protein for murein synthesis (MipA/OmpV family)
MPADIDALTRPAATLRGLAWLMILVLCAPLATRAAEVPTADAASASADPEKPDAGGGTAARRPEIEGAIGPILRFSPVYPGASDYKAQLTPAGFIRWGRFTLSGAGGFTTQRRDEVERGLGIDLVRSTAVHLKLGLRFDNGRSESDSPRLAGLGDIRRTVRVRLAARWEINDDWQAAAGISTDALNRVGGYLVDISLARHWHLSQGSLFTLSAGLSGAGDRYLQTWHGVTAEQSAASGLPVYRISEGLRDANLSAVWRREFSPRWAGFVGLAGSRMLGSTVDSPLTLKTQAWLASGALVWRF